MNLQLQKKPFIVGVPQHVSGDAGYKLNIYERSLRGEEYGTRVCQIPNFSSRSKKAVLDLGMRIAAIPVMEECLLMLATTEEPKDLVALGMQAYAREALTIAGLWPAGGDA